MSVFVLITEVFIDPDIGKVVVGVAASEEAARRMADTFDPPPNWLERSGQHGFEIIWEEHDVES